MESITRNIEQETNAVASVNVDQLVEYALHYAAQGWRVLPVHSVRNDGSCTCDKGSVCDSPGKHPRIVGWPEKATTDPNVIRGWWEQWPNANVGIACGEESNLVVLDVDPRNGGSEALRKLTSRHGELPHTLRVVSGGGGEHHYFKLPEDRVPTTKLGTGLDLQSDGAFVVAPPSAHRTGGSYEWRESVGDADLPELQPLPDWIVAQARGNSSSHSAGRLPPPEPGEVIVEGERDDRLTSLAGHLRNLNLTESEIADALVAINRERCRPPLPEEQVRKIAKSIGNREVNGATDPGREGDDPFGFTLASEIEPENIEWFWPDKIPLKKITLLVGDGGLGKSTLSLDLAARLTRGKAMPGATSQPEPGRALILSTEDGPSDTIRPRLEAAGADLDHVMIQTKGGASFPDHLDDLERQIIQFGADLVIIDPITGFLGEGINMNLPQDVRRVLAPLKEIAERSGCTILLVVHLNQKESRSAHHRILGSGDIVNAARSALVVAEDPDDEERRVIAQVKSNLGPSPSALSFQMASSPERGGHPRIEWLGESPYGANDLLLTSAYSNAPTKKERAKVFIKNALQNGPVRATEMYRLATDRGLSERTLKRAKKELSDDVVSKRPPGFDDREWYWLLVEHEEAFESGEWPGGEAREDMTPLDEENGGKPFDVGPSTEEATVGALGGDGQSSEEATKRAIHDPIGVSSYDIEGYEPYNAPRRPDSNDHRNSPSAGGATNRILPDNREPRSDDPRRADRVGGR